MNNLQENYNKSIDAYIKEFEKTNEIDFEYWVGDKVGEIAVFGDYYFNFADIKYVVDNQIKFEWLSDWYYFLVDFGEKCPIDLESYCKLRRGYESENFDLHHFEKNLIYMRLEKK